MDEARRGGAARAPRLAGRGFFHLSAAISDGTSFKPDPRMKVRARLALRSRLFARRSLPQAHLARPCRFKSGSGHQLDGASTLCRASATSIRENARSRGRS
jgi:hypothetical protein